MDPLVLTHSRKVWGKGFALWNPRILKQSICHAIILTSAKIIIFSVWYAITPRVVDPLSLATIADSIMVEVEDLNHYGVGLFDSRFRFIRFCVGNIGFVFSRSPYGSLEGDGARAFRPLKSSFPKPNYCLIKFRKI